MDLNVETEYSYGATGRFTQNKIIINGKEYYKSESDERPAQWSDFPILIPLNQSGQGPPSFIKIDGGENGLKAFRYYHKEEGLPLPWGKEPRA